MYLVIWKLVKLTMYASDELPTMSNRKPGCVVSSCRATKGAPGSSRAMAGSRRTIATGDMRRSRFMLSSFSL